MNNLRSTDGNFSISLQHDVSKDEIIKRTKFNKLIKEYLTGCSFIDNNRNITNADIINLRCFAKIYGLEMIISSKSCIQLKKGNDIWVVEKTQQYKPFVRSNIYYRYRTNKEHKTRCNGEKTMLNQEEFVDILIERNTQLSFDNKCQKYYVKHEKYGNLYFSTDVLIHNGSIGVYAITIKNLYNKVINISHFIYDMLNYDINTIGVKIFGDINNAEYLYFNKIINKIKI